MCKIIRPPLIIISNYARVGIFPTSIALNVKLLRVQFASKTQLRNSRRTVGLKHTNMAMICVWCCNPIHLLHFFSEPIITDVIVNRNATGNKLDSLVMHFWIHDTLTVDNL